MLTGTTLLLSSYKDQIPEKLYKYIQFASSFRYDETEDTKVMLDDGDYMSVESCHTEPAVMRRMEGHEKFIDIHYLISGEEWIGTVPRSKKTVLHESYTDRDLYFFSGEKEESKILLTPGRFAIFYPVDLHRPLCAGTSGCKAIRKAIIKVHVK